MGDQRIIRVMAAEVSTDGLLNLDEAIAFLASARESIPAEFRASADFSIETDYDGVTDVSVWYERTETVSEREERENAERAAEERRRIRNAMMEAAPSTWWADADRVNFARYQAVYRKAFPDADDVGARIAFHHEAVRVNADAAKPSWWVDQTKTAEG